jgi:hypothetical protein
LAEQTGRPEVAQARSAPIWERLLSETCLGDDGLPRRISALDDLGAFGVKATKVAGEPPYLDYVARDDDVDLRAALDRVVAERRMLLVVGGSASGKSRSTAEALRQRLPDRVRGHAQAAAGVWGCGRREHPASRIRGLDGARRSARSDRRRAER